MKTTNHSRNKIFHADSCLRLFLVYVLLLSCVGYVYSATSQAPQKVATAIKLEGAVTLDGKLDEPAWQKAPVQTGFEMPLSSANRKPIPAEMQTSFRVLYDDNNLYFGIRCNEPKPGSLAVQAARQHDAAMWWDDDIELFFDPVGDRNEYYQLAINSEGTEVDLYYIEGGNTGKGGWSSEWQTAVYKGDKFWSLEIVIPLALFHNRPARMWADRWVFSIARSRFVKAGQYYSQFSPANGYHDVKNFGYLDGIKVDKSRFNLYAESPSFRLEPAADGFKVLATLSVENRGDQPYQGSLTMDIQAEGAKGNRVPLQLPPNSKTRVVVPDGFVMKPGKWPVIFRAESENKTKALIIRFDNWMTYTPLTIRVTQPNYRNNIYASQPIDAIKGIVTLGVPLETVTGSVLRVGLSSCMHTGTNLEITVDKKELPFELPAKDLPIGNYIVRAELRRPISNPMPQGPKFDLLYEQESVVRKLPPAPAVEARIDDQGNLLINGRPVFIRGWYGSMNYMVSLASLPQAQLPHSCNYLMGATAFDAANMGLYTLAGVATLIDESKSKLDQPIDGELKAKLREVIAKVRANHNIIGYYLSDEPECSGKSPVFLKSLYEFMAQEDPYRFCKIVSRAPAEYISACDVMCPHPYMSPQLMDDGKRMFAKFLKHIHNTITEAGGANDGSKAVWSMPGIFSYSGLRGQEPTFAESRWFVHTSIACGAKGIVPFIFCDYWKHFESRVAMDAVYEELTLLAPAWTARDAAIEITGDNPAVDAIAKYYKPAEAGSYGHTFIVTANQSYGPNKAKFTVPTLTKNKNTRLLVIRENRVVPVENGTFTDEFQGLGAHVYTTMEIVPYFRTLDEIQNEIASALRRPADEGNILASGKVKWCTGNWGNTFQGDSHLADGIKDAAVWLPAYSDPTQLVILFEKPVSFSRLEFYTPNIKAADLDIWENNAWKTIFQWQDQYLYKLTYRGKSITTDRIRIRPTANRIGFGSSTYNEITEIGIYK